MVAASKVMPVNGIVLALTVCLLAPWNSNHAQAAPAVPAKPPVQVNTKEQLAQVAPLLTDSRIMRLGGNVAGAEEKAKKAVTAARNSKDIPTIISALMVLADCYAAQEKFEEEEPLRKESASLAEKAYGANSPEAAEQQAFVADRLARKGESSNAWAILEKAMNTMAAHAQTHPLELSATYLANAHAEIAARNFGLAEEPMQKALANREKKLSKNDPRVLEVVAEYAKLLDLMKRPEDASKQRERVTMGLATLSTQTPGVVSTKVTGSGAFQKYADAAKKADAAGNHDEALANWKLAVAEVEKTGGSDGRLAYALVHVGDQYLYKNQNNEAEVVFKRAMEVRDKNGGAAGLGGARNLSRLAMIHFGKSRHSEAEPLLAKALELQEKAGASPTTIANTLNYLVSIYVVSKNHSKGEEACKKLLQLVEQNPTKVAAFKKLTATSMLASIYMQTGRMQQGMELMKGMSTGQQSQEAITEAVKNETATVEREADVAEEANFH